MTPATVERINQALNELAEELECPVHRKHPNLKLKGYDFQIECCCFKFKAECVKQVAQRIGSPDNKVIA